MKKSTIIAILILIAGLLLITLGLASLRGNWAKLNGKKTSGRYVGRTYTCSGMITSLSGTHTFSILTTREISIPASSILPSAVSYEPTFSGLCASLLMTNFTSYGAHIFSSSKQIKCILMKSIVKQYKCIREHLTK